MSILKENAETCPDCRTSDEEGARELDREIPRVNEAKTRKCLVCKAPFPSAWSGERVCRRCKATSAWRGGALG